MIPYFLADPGEARSCSKNRAVTDSFINYLILFLSSVVQAKRKALTINTKNFICYACFVISKFKWTIKA